MILKLRDLIQVPSDVSARLDAELRGRTDAGTLATALNGTGGGAYFSRQLEVVLAEVLKVPQSPMSGFELFPINTSLPEGAESYTQRVEDEYGEAQVGGNMADDPPTSDVTRSEFTMAIAPIKTGFTYSVQDIAASIMTGMNLSQDRAAAAMTASKLCAKLMSSSSTRTYLYFFASASATWRKSGGRPAARRTPGAPRPPPLLPNPARTIACHVSMSPSAPRVVMNVLGIFSMVCASASYLGWVPMTAGNTSAEMPCCSSLRGEVESDKERRRGQQHEPLT
jgi:hypothetical protein